MESEQGLQILIIDDTPSKRRFIKTGIAGYFEDKAPLLDYTVTEAKDAAEALTLMKTKAFDIVFCDMEMEKKTSGLEVISACRTNEKNTSAMIIGQSRDPGVKDKMIAAGADDFIYIALTKNNNPITRIHEVLEKYLQSKSAGFTARANQPSPPGLSGEVIQ